MLLLSRHFRSDLLSVVKRHFDGHLLTLLLISFLISLLLRNSKYGGE